MMALIALIAGLTVALAAVTVGTISLGGYLSRVDWPERPPTARRTS